MKMMCLPSGKIMNPAHVGSVSVHAHFWDSKKFYVQMSLKKGETEDIAEKLDREEAIALRDEYVGIIRDAYADSDAYQLGYEEGYAQGRGEGYDAGKSDGHNSGYAAGIASATEGHEKKLLAQLYEYREELITEQRNGGALTPDRRRYLRHSISAMTDVIARLSPLPL